MQYEGDILCLQEVSRDVYETYLGPVLAARGYRGVYANKISQHTAIG
jgi:mRNA deadenylase 3'-5' endonuclease subunit Ccr4